MLLQRNTNPFTKGARGETSLTGWFVLALVIDAIHIRVLLAAATWLVAGVATAQDRTAPTAVLDAPDRIGVAAPLPLSASRSTDVGGRIVRYTWTRIEGSGGPMVLGQPVVTETDSYLVPQSPGDTLAAGRHRFRLVVTDDSGNRSQPAERAIIVVDDVPPTAVPAAPSVVMQMQPFQLSAARSLDVGGRIVRYRWTRVSGSAAGPMPLGHGVETDATDIVVTQSPTSYLGVGRQVFRLIVVDDAGNQSRPAELAVAVSAPLPAGRSQ